MSSIPMGDAKPDAVAEADHALPTGIAGNAAEPSPEAEPETGQDAEPDPGPEPDPDPAPEPEPDPGPEPDPDPAPELDPDPDPVAEPAPRRHWRGLLIGAVFVLAALAIIGGAFAIVGSLTHGFKKPVIITYKKSAIFSLRTGECIDPNGQQAASIVPCATAHQAEVFATFTLPAAKWPGVAGVRTTASAGCASRLAGYLNPQLAISLTTTYVYPDKVAWQQGTRKVTCEVRAASGDLTGSVRGATAG